MHKQTVEPKVDLVVVIGEPWNGYQQARVVLTDPQGSRCVDALNLDMSDVGDVKDITANLVDAVRNPEGIEELVLSLIIKSPTGAVTPDRLRDKVIRHYASPSVARIKALDYFRDLQEPPESNDLLTAAIDRAAAYWYMSGWVIQLDDGLDLFQQTKPGRVLREVALGTDPIAEIS